MKNKMVTIEKMCPFCGRVNSLYVRADHLKDYENGALVQDAFPELTAEEREFLITGMCKTCQKDIFG